ncbi:hypothetical protein HDU83_002997 [Entophlyctis luteolus]|nr:hypothetical protein HDU83_002997 [Entophlyctis luteolus]
MFVVMQLIYTGIVSIPVYIIYRYQYFQLSFIIVITTIAVWNGAGYYVFKLSQSNGNGVPIPDSPEPSEVWFRRYIRRGPSISTASQPSTFNDNVRGFSGLKRGVSVAGGQRKMSINDISWDSVESLAPGKLDGNEGNKLEATVSNVEAGGIENDGFRKRK